MIEHISATTAKDDKSGKRNRILITTDKVNSESGNTIKRKIVLKNIPNYIYTELLNKTTEIQFSVKTKDTLNLSPLNYQHITASVLSNLKSILVTTDRVFKNLLNKNDDKNIIKVKVKINMVYNFNTIKAEKDLMITSKIKDSGNGYPTHIFAQIVKDEKGKRTKIILTSDCLSDNTDNVIKKRIVINNLIDKVGNVLNINKEVSVYNKNKEV